MPTTTKGLPYPLSTAPPNIPADLQALAQALDFTVIPLLSAAGSGITNASFLDAYPIGVSVLSLASADGAAGGWPGAGSSHVWTFKPTTTRAFQLIAMTGITRSWYRYLAASPGPNGAWVSLVDGSQAWTAIPAASGHTSNASSILENGVTVRLKGWFTKSAPPLVRATSVGIIPAAHRPPQQLRVSLALGTASSGPAAVGAIIDTDGTIQLTGDATSIGTQSQVFVDGVTYRLT